MPILGARVTSVSPNLAVAKQRGVSLYREWLRAIPTIIELHHLDLTKKQIVNRVRTEFEKNRHVNDYRALDMLNLKGHMELQETANLWKNKTHVMRYFDDDGMTEYKPQQSSFLNDFYKGRKSI